MKRLVVLLVVLPAALAFGEGARPPVKATHTIELSSPAGDVSPIHSSGGDYPGFDVVKLAVRSDGQRIAVAATLKDPPGEFASEVVRVYFDTDNNASTGAQFTFPKIGGFEYGGELDACVSYADRSTACAGGSKSKAVDHWGAANVERYKGKGQFDTETVVDSMGFAGKKASPRTPIKGTLVESAIDYADLQVKPGQTIRIVVKKSHASSASPTGGFFPDIVLTLK